MFALSHFFQLIKDYSLLYRLDRLSSTKLNEIAIDLYKVHCQIFGGTKGKDFDEFFRYVMATTGLINKLKIYVRTNKTTGKNQIIGYFAFHFYRIDVEGVPYNVAKMETGLLPQYRGRAIIPPWLFYFECIKIKILHPFTKTYFFGCLISPASYKMVSKNYKIFPSQSREIPNNISKLLIFLGKKFYPEGDPNNPLVRNVGWISLESKRQTNFWQSHRDPDVQYYLKQNPRYLDGFGLATIGFVSVKNLLSGMLKWMNAKLHRFHYRNVL